jgi:hypothetical protein
MVNICTRHILYDLLEDQVQKEEMGVHVALMARKINAYAYRVLIGGSKINMPHEIPTRLGPKISVLTIFLR